MLNHPIVVVWAVNGRVAVSTGVVRVHGAWPVMNLSAQSRGWTCLAAASERAYTIAKASDRTYSSTFQNGIGQAEGMPLASAGHSGLDCSAHHRATSLL